MARILVIEAHQAARTLIERRFDTALSIESVGTLQAALDNHNRDPFDLVIWDTLSAPADCSKTVRAVNKFFKNSRHQSYRSFRLEGTRDYKRT
jgi:DNA-binding NtrC family response regulator